MSSPSIGSPSTNRVGTRRANSTSRQARDRRSNSSAQTALSYSEQGLKVKHPDGTVLQVTGIRFGSDRIVVGLSVVNRSPRTVTLNTNRQDLVLIDNLGNQYDVIPLIDNPKVEVPPYGTLNGQFAFATQLDSKATSLTLIANRRSGSLSKTATAPRIIVNLPMSK
ncbi:hypothetical protein VB735_25920 [Halotia wernerae UHCC 0503]|nr:hypothetical protein [Halotia wernerae UHCC 0503]